MNSFIGLITARGGSKGLPGKNIAPLAGRPLIAWTIAAASNSTRLDDVIVSTDDETIANVAREHGASVPFLRPSALAGDASPHILAALHAIEWLRGHGNPPTHLVLLQPTSPLRVGADIDAAVDLIGTTGAPAIVSVVEPQYHPLLAFALDPAGLLQPFAGQTTEYRRRQDLPPAYAPNGAIYVNAVESLERDRTFVPEGARPYLMPAARSLDIDTAWDLRLAELILTSEIHGSRPD